MSFVQSSPTDLEERAQALLKAWRLGLLSGEHVVDWADARIVESPNPGKLPNWLYSLSSFGPQKCSELPYREFELSWLETDFVTEFVAAACVLNLDHIDQVEAFVRWASRRCMGEDLKVPEVAFSYHLDHLWDDCDRMDLAVDLVRRELPELLPRCRAIVEGLLGCAGEPTPRPK